VNGRAIGAVLVGLVVGCASPGTASRKPAVVEAVRRLSVDDLLAHPADVKVTLHPPAVVHDRVYGSLLRKVSALAAAYAGPRTVGTTALAALERTDEVDAALNDDGEAVVILRGVPGDLDVNRVVDEAGHAVWRPIVGDLRHTFVEYEALAEADATLFVVGRVWVVAAGAARMRTREALIDAPGGASFAEGEPGLAVITIRGAALVRRDARLRSGSLAPLGRSLSEASFELTPGALGVLVTRLDYTEVEAAAGAEHTARDIVAAFRRLLEEGQKGGGVKAHSEPPPLSWLAAAGVERAGQVVTVRAPIPRSWLDAIARAELAPLPASPRDTGEASATHTDIPWDLWRRSAPIPTLSLPAQEPSQAGGSL
jgi:hypothetical protein